VRHAAATLVPAAAARHGLRKPAKAVVSTPTTEPHSIETPHSWVIAVVSLACLSTGFGAPWITAVALKTMAADMGGARSVPGLAVSLAWFGQAAGGMLMGTVAERFGIRRTVIFGASMVFIGLFISSLGQPWQLYLGHGLFIGFLGNSGLNAPLYVYVSRWFDRRRGSALALISSGGYLAGFLWPVLFERATSTFGWRWTMIGYGVLVLTIILPLAIVFLRPAPEHASGREAKAAAAGGALFGWNPNLVFLILGTASFLCCVTMSMPQGHLVALCTDLGLSASLGAAMLSLLLGAGFVSRQAWGLVADRYGGLRTALVSSALQAAATTGFLYVQEEIGVFTVSLAFGLGFSALIPAYVLAVRELYPVAEAYWRVPALLFLSGSGMATGGWLAGYLYDHFGHYGPAFTAGVVFNLANLALLALLVLRQRATAMA
jgi:MFS family permease